MNGLMPREQNSDHQISLGGPVQTTLFETPAPNFGLFIQILLVFLKNFDFSAGLVI